MSFSSWYGERMGQNADAGLAVLPLEAGLPSRWWRLHRMGLSDFRARKALRVRKELRTQRKRCEGVNVLRPNVRNCESGRRETLTDFQHDVGQAADVFGDRDARGRRA